MEKQPNIPQNNKKNDDKVTTVRKDNKNLDEINNKTYKPVTRESHNSVTPAKITPGLSVKVRGKNVTDLMSLNSFLVRKKSEHESKQAQTLRVTTTAMSRAATGHTSSGQNS